MKKNYSILVLVLIFASYTMAMSQNLDSIPKAQRDSILISVAKEVVLTYGPDYYREYKEPVIERGQVLPKGSINTTGKNAGRIFYTVTFLYDKTQEQLSKDFAASVQIWADTGKASGVLFGNDWGRIVSETGLRSGEVIEQTPYEQREVFPIYDWNDPDNKEPKNKNELIKKGYEERENGQWVKVKPDVPPVQEKIKKKE